MRLLKEVPNNHGIMKEVEDIYGSTMCQKYEKGEEDYPFSLL